MVFVSKGGLPRVLQNAFTEMNIPIIRATQAESHAEIAARDFGRNVQLQEQALEGRIIRVNAAIVSNRVCSLPINCPAALTEYIGDEGVTIEEGGRGFIRTATQQLRVFQGSFMNEVRGTFGGAGNLEAIANLAASEGVADVGPIGNEP